MFKHQATVVKPQNVDIHYETLLTLSDIPVSEMNKTAVIAGWQREANHTHYGLIFLRPHLLMEKLEIDNFMKEIQTRMRNMYVSGPPGSGKTISFLAYFMQWARKHKKCGFIVQYQQQSSGNNSSSGC